MNAKKLVPTLIAASLAAGTTTAPLISAADSREMSSTNAEQAGDQMQSAVKDAWLDGKLESALLFNQHLNSFSIDTDVKNGVAYLSGVVESDIDRDLAGEIAESIKGVHNVENQLVIDKEKAAASRNDNEAIERKGFQAAVANATLTARIKSELLINSNTAGLSIDVDSRDGNVTLSGEVDSQQEKELAEKIADNTNGEGRVDNRLAVRKDS